jgi:hypothetical protein
MRKRTPPARGAWKFTRASKRPESTSPRSKAERSVASGPATSVVFPVDGAGSVWSAAGAASVSVRALWTASTVTPSRRAPRTARRKGREIAIATHIGSRQRWV